MFLMFSSCFTFGDFFLTVFLSLPFLLSVFSLGKQLHAQKNGLGTEGGKAIAAMVKCNSTLVHLDLSDNNLGAAASSRMGAQWTSLPVTADKDFFFEVEAKHVATDGTCIGLAHASYDMDNNQVGWRADSYGYHSDDGGLFAEQGSHASSGSIWSVGDRVGCGYESSSGSIYFTHNGDRVGKALPVNINKPLFPTLTSGPSNQAPAVSLLTPSMQHCPPDRGGFKVWNDGVSLHVDSALFHLTDSLALNTSITSVSHSLIVLSRFVFVFCRSCLPSTLIPSF